MATFNQQGQKVENQINVDTDKLKVSAVKVYGKTASNLRELSAKRKKERHTYRTQEEILDQLINQAYKRECNK